MIPVNEGTTTVVSNMEGDSGAFGIEEDSLAHIMAVLSGLYSDEEAAVVREYLTNAYDAQVDAGMVPGTDSWVPIQVGTPNKYDHLYFIRDYGVGMSADGIKHVFSKYGKSTKRNSNKTTGTLGLGSKSALTYTNSFTFIGYKDGIKTTAFITKGEDDIPYYTIVDESETDEFNGVEIRIPVRDRDSFYRKTEVFLSYWESGLVMIDGQPNQKRNTEAVGELEIKYNVAGSEVVDKAFIEFIPRRTWSSKNYVVMGNVPYPIEDEHIPPIDFEFVAYVPMGSVKFAPSRESLQYTKTTLSVLNQIADNIKEKVVEKYRDEVEEDWDAGAIYGWMNRTPNWVIDHLHSSGFMPNGYPLRDNYVTHWVLDIDTHTTRLEAHQRMSIYWGISNNMKNTLIVTGFGGGRLSTQIRKQIRAYVEENSHRDTVILIDGDEVDFKWWSHLPTVSLDEIKKIKVGNSETFRDATLWRYNRKEKTAEPEQDYSKISKILKRAKKVAFVSPADFKKVRNTQYGRTKLSAGVALNYLGKDLVIVIIPRNKWKKFREAWPKAKPISCFIEDELKRRIATIPPRKDCNVDYSMQIFLQTAELSKVDDPRFAELAKVYKEGDNGYDEYLEFTSMLSFFGNSGIEFESPSYERPVDTLDYDLSEDYPLFDNVNFYYSSNKEKIVEQLVHYVNAVYNHPLTPTSARLYTESKST